MKPTRGAVLVQLADCIFYCLQKISVHFPGTYDMWFVQVSIYVSPIEVGKVQRAVVRIHSVRREFNTFDFNGNDTRYRIA